MSGFLGSTRAPLRWVRRVTGISMRFSLRCGLGGCSTQLLMALSLPMSSFFSIAARALALSPPGYISRLP